MDVRTRNWLFVFWPESAPADWREVIDSWHVTCYVSPLHDMDVWTEGDERKNPEHVAGQLKKPHYHGVLCFEGVKSYKQVMNLLSELNISTCKVCESFQNSVRYLCHLDHKEKAQYLIQDLTLFGRCDLAPFYDKSYAEESLAVANLVQFARDSGITEFHTLVDTVMFESYDDLWPVLRKNAQFFRAYFQSLHYSLAQYKS